MPQTTDPNGPPLGNQVKDEAKSHPPWTAIAGKGIGFTVSTITLFAILELTVLQFMPSRLASTELTAAVIAGAVLLSCAGSMLYFYRNQKITIRLWIASAVALALTAAMVVMAAVVVVAWQRPTRGMDGSPLVSLPLTQAEQELNSRLANTRLAGIAELKRIMQAQPSTQPAAIRIICSSS